VYEVGCLFQIFWVTYWLQWYLRVSSLHQLLCFGNFVCSFEEVRRRSTHCVCSILLWWKLMLRIIHDLHLSPHLEPPTTVRNLAVTITASNSITIEWDPPLRTGDGFYYVVEYSNPDDISMYNRHTNNFYWPFQLQLLHCW